LSYNKNYYLINSNYLSWVSRVLGNFNSRDVRRQNQNKHADSHDISQLDAGLH